VGRGITRLLVAVVVLVVLVVGIDRLALYLVDRGVAAQLQKAEQLTPPVDVSVQGFPFLTQAAAGLYDTVDVTLHGVPATNGLVIDQLDATLHGVHAPAAQAVSGQLSSLPVDSGTAVAQVSFKSLTAAAVKALPTDGVTLTMGRATANRVALRAQVDTPLGELAVSGQAQLGISKGRIAVELLPETLTGLPSGLRDQVAQQLDLSALTPQLPFGLRARSVTVEPNGLQVQAYGTSLTIE
jgi:hypothetical protein